MNLLPKDLNGCPFLILAPMEGVGDETFRKAMSHMGGFDEIVREFLRVPKNAHVKSLAIAYNAQELDNYRLVPQLMGSDPLLMAEMAQEMEKRGARRIDLNCGCPSNTVTGRGAGSSLLKEPSFLHEVAKALVQAVNIPVTLKMRSGYHDTALFRENLKAAEESGVAYITLHPRTKVDGYGPPAKWELIAEAKSLLKIPLVGNGDILTVADARRMLQETKCDALMIGRGSLINPFLFHEIRASYSPNPYLPTWEALSSYLTFFLNHIEPTLSIRHKTNKLKQLLSFIFKWKQTLQERRAALLTAQASSFEAFSEYALRLLKEGF